MIGPPLPTADVVARRVQHDLRAGLVGGREGGGSGGDCGRVGGGGGNVQRAHHLILEFTSLEGFVV